MSKVSISDYSFTLLLFLIIVVASTYSIASNHTRRQRVSHIACDGGFGSGFFISPNLFVTASHVLGACYDKNTITVNDTETLQEVLLDDKENDITVLKTTPVDPVYIFPIDCKMKPFAGQAVLLRGNIRGSRNSIDITSSVAIPSWVTPDNATVPKYGAIVYKSIKYGMSGGPVLSSDTKKVIGWLVYTVNQEDPYTGIGTLSNVCNVLLPLMKD